MLKVYGIKTCDSVKKARKFLDHNGIEYVFIDFKETPVGCDLIQKWSDKVDMKKLFNIRSTTYRNLQLKDLDLNDSQKIEWLCKENLLIKRPILETQNSVMVGFNQALYEELFL